MLVLVMVSSAGSPRISELISSLVPWEHLAPACWELRVPQSKTAHMRAASTLTSEAHFVVQRELCAA